MREVDRASLRPPETEPEPAARPAAATDEPKALLLAIQRTAGNRAVVGLLRQPAPGQVPARDPAAGVPGEQGFPTFEALSHRLWGHATQLVALNATAPVAGERLQLSAQVQA